MSSNKTPRIVPIKHVCNFTIDVKSLRRSDTGYSYARTCTFPGCEEKVEIERTTTDQAWEDYMKAKHQDAAET